MFHSYSLMLKGSENAASNPKGRSKATFELNVKTVENVIFGEENIEHFHAVCGIL